MIKNKLTGNFGGKICELINLSRRFLKIVPLEFGNSNANRTDVNRTNERTMREKKTYVQFSQNMETKLKKGESQKK